jgi:periplasmic protein TonB
MSTVTAVVPDVFTPREIAAAAGVSVGDVRALVAAGDIGALDGRFVPEADAVRAVRILRGIETAQMDRALFRPQTGTRRSPGGALAASGALHLAVLGCLVLLATMGAVTAPQKRDTTQVRLVFLATRGPGGGGGGGGLHQPAPPPKAKMKGTSPLRSPVPPPRPITTKPPDPKPVPPPPPVAIQPAPKPVEPPPPAPVEVPLPQVVAPVATAPADTRDRAGVLSNPPESESHGPGSGTGVGSGQGTGIGEGSGSGIGPGSGGGTGGGPYRPGSGITPPAIVREVKPDYTEEARRRGLAGDVVVEIIVRADGTVGSVKLLQGLGSGLDQRAIDAVRQWRFSPARRFGTPVDVVVEVAVEFKLR